MSLDEQTITAILRTKNADESHIARAARLIGNASPFGASNKEAILAISEYVCHVSDVLPNLPNDGELAENADALTYGLSDGAGLDAWIDVPSTSSHCNTMKARWRHSSSR